MFNLGFKVKSSDIHTSVLLIRYASKLNTNTAMMLLKDRTHQINLLHHHYMSESSTHSCTPDSTGNIVPLGGG